MHLESLATLYSVANSTRSTAAGSLPGFRTGNEAGVEARGEGAAEDESARLDAHDRVDVLADEALGDPVEHDVEGPRAREQRGDVLEDDAGLRKVGHVANERATEIEGRLRPRRDRHREGRARAERRRRERGGAVRGAGLGADLRLVVARGARTSFGGHGRNRGSRHDARSALLRPPRAATSRGHRGGLSGARHVEDRAG